MFGVIIKATGMTPEEIEARITAPVEVELLGIPNQSHILIFFGISVR